MPISTKIIKRRIKSVANTRKITKAMELVAGAKMRKAVRLTLLSRDYARSIQTLTDNIRRRIAPHAHPLLAGPMVSAMSLVIVASSDKGLCGSFNSQILKQAFEFLHTRSESIQVVTVGKRAEQSVKRAGYSILAAFEAISGAPSFERTRPVGALVYNEFMSGKADRVFIVFMDFKNAVIQTPITQQLLPIIPERELLNVMPVPSWTLKDMEVTDESDAQVLFEPNPASILDLLLPRLIETRIYQALLESSASEHSARMLAMQNATENATEMLEDLAFTFNQARQATITREISEISAGKAAIA